MISRSFQPHGVTFLRFFYTSFAVKCQLTLNYAIYIYLDSTQSYKSVLKLNLNRRNNQVTFPTLYLTQIVNKVGSIVIEIIYKLYI